MNYLLFSGFKGSGKDTFADLVMAELKSLGVDVKKYSLAGKLKEVCCQNAKLPIEYAYDEVLKETILDTPIKFGPKELEATLEAFDVQLDPAIKKNLLDATKDGFESMRKSLQFVGTDILRHASADIHCEVTAEQIRKDKVELAIISDCRFFNEIDYFKGSMAFFVHRKAKMPINSPDLHRSEREMFEIMSELPWIDNNDSLEKLKKKAQRLAVVILDAVQRPGIAWEAL